MGIFDRLRAMLDKAVGVQDPIIEESKEQPREELEEVDGMEAFRRELREHRKRRGRPTLGREDATDKFYSYQGKEFDFSDVPVAQYAEATHYLLDGANADKFIDDLAALDVFAEKAEAIADVPNFRLPINDILLTPEWREIGMDMSWTCTRIYPLPLTKTGKPPKYPFRVYVETRAGIYSARIKYTQDDVIGEAEIRVNSPNCYHIMTVRNGEIIRIIRTVGMENFPVYSNK